MRDRFIYREGARGFRWALFAVALAALLAVAAAFAFGWAQRATASFRGATAEREMTQADGRFRLATYEEFHNLCAAVQNAEAQITALESELETGPPQARVTHINSSLTAVRSARASNINDYNSRAAQEHRAAFHSNDLPETLSLDTEETSCTA